MAPRSRTSSSLAAASALALGLLACGRDPDAAYSDLPRGRSNVLVFLVDTLRTDRLGAYGSAAGLTPRIDAFAREGLTFERCIAQGTWTKPSTASLLTGLYPHAHGANYSRSILPGSVTTLAELLADAGYDTGAFGSNPHVFADSPGVTGFEQGFRTFEPIEPARDAPSPRAERIVDAALDWLGAPRDGPWLLYLHLLDPHFPYEPPGREERRLWDMDVAKALAPPERAVLVELYDQEVAYVDAQFGRLLDGLAQLGMDEETLVVFVSDHGEEFFEHGGLGHHEGKMFEETARVPLIVRVPGLPRAERGRVVGGIVEQVDVLPTIVDALGLPMRGAQRARTAPGAQAGTSLLARALSAEDGAPGRDHALMETEDTVVGKGLVTRDWKYVRRWSPDEAEELYRTSDDPGELVDRAERDPDVLRAMRRMLARELAQAPPTYELRVENGGAELLVLAGRIETHASRIEMVQLVDAEPQDQDGGDGPFDQTVDSGAGAWTHASTFVMRIAPGDRDGFVFRPHADDAMCRIDLQLGSTPLAPAQVALGPDGHAPATMPFELVAADSGALASGGEFPLGPLSDGLKVRIWRVLWTAGEEAALSADDAAILRALGYAGDDAPPTAGDDAPPTDR